MWYIQSVCDCGTGKVYTEGIVSIVRYKQLLIKIKDLDTGEEKEITDSCQLDNYSFYNLVGTTIWFTTEVERRGIGMMERIEDSAPQEGYDLVFHREGQTLCYGRRVLYIRALPFKITEKGEDKYYWDGTYSNAAVLVSYLLSKLYNIGDIGCYDTYILASDENFAFRVVPSQFKQYYAKYLMLNK